MPSLNPGDLAIVIASEVEANRSVIGEIVEILYEWPENNFLLPDGILHAGRNQANALFNFDIARKYWVIKSPVKMPLVDPNDKVTGYTHYGPWAASYLLPVPRDDFDLYDEFSCDTNTGILIDFDKYRSKPKRIAA